jgi:hypothetical protein
MNHLSKTCSLAVLERDGRVSMIDLSYFRTNIRAAMQVPFPELESSATRVESSKSAESFPIFSWLDQPYVPVVEGYFIFEIAEATSIYHLPWGYSSLWIHFTPSDGRFCIDQSQEDFPSISYFEARTPKTTSDSVKSVSIALGSVDRRTRGGYHAYSRLHFRLVESTYPTNSPYA